MKNVVISKRYNRGEFVGWKKYIGGHDICLTTGTDATAKRSAKRLADALVARHKLQKATGGDWTKDVIDECKATVLGAADRAKNLNVPAPCPTPSGVVSSPAIMLFGAMEQYKQYHRARCDANEIGVDAYASTAERIDKAKEGISDRPMNTIMLGDLAALRQHFTSRPMSEKTGKPISVQTVVNVVSASRGFFGWCRRYVGWTPPLFWEDELKVNPKKLRNVKEKKQKAKGFQNFTVTELQVLWHMATPFARLMIGLGYWCGWTQKEIAMLLRDDIVEKDGEIYIDRLRHKTEVRGYWWLPPEVATLLMRFKASDTNNPMGLALMGSRGNPIVHASIRTDGRKKKSDLVHCLWNRLRKRAEKYGVHALSFKYLRKSSSQKVRDKLSREYAQLFCAQVQESVADESYNRASFDRLETAVREIYSEMRQMFEPIELRQFIPASDVAAANARVPAAPAYSQSTPAPIAAVAA